jgi:hypothetical protein
MNYLYFVQTFLWFFFPSYYDWASISSLGVWLVIFLPFNTINLCVKVTGYP